MENDVHNVVAVGLKTAEVEVEVAVGEHCKRAVRLVALDAPHRSAPKVVLEDVP